MFYFRRTVLYSIIYSESLQWTSPSPHRRRYGGGTPIRILIRRCPCIWVTLRRPPSHQHPQTYHTPRGSSLIVRLSSLSLPSSLSSSVSFRIALNTTCTKHTCSYYTGGAYKTPRFWRWKLIHKKIISEFIRIGSF